MRSTRIGALFFVLLATAPAAFAGDLVVSGFEPGQAWAGTSWVVAAPWPDAFAGGYALHVTDKLQYKRWPLSGSFSETLLSVRMHFRVQSDTLGPDPEHDNSPFESITLFGAMPKDVAGKRPQVGLKRDDDHLIFRIEDYDGFEYVRDTAIIPDRWHVLDVLLDQGNTRFAVALDGVTVFDDVAADIDEVGPFTFVELGLVYSEKNGHSLWLDNFKIRDSGGLQGPELVASATATPGVGKVPVTVSYALDTSVGSPTIEWDFEGDGVIDATGFTASKKYSTAGTYKPVARVTNSSGRAAVYPPMIHAFGSSAPTVTLQAVRGGDPTLAFPRVFDFVANVTPASGSKITKVEFDWKGGGIYAWNARANFKDGAPIEVRMPHEFPFDSITAVVRARATDDAGRVSSGEVVVDLPVGPGNPTIPPRDSRSGIYVTYGWPEMYVNRGNALPAWVAGSDVGAYLKWNEIETADNVFDFGPVNGSDPFTYNGRLTQIANSGKNVILHHQAGFPAWLLAKVGKSTKKNPGGDNYPQFWDPRYQDYLARFIDAQADNVQAILGLHSSWSSRFVLSRGQWLAVDSELLPTSKKLPVVAFPGTSSAMDLTSAKFTAGSLGAYSVDFSQELVNIYAANVRAMYENSFGPLGIPCVFKPMAGGWYNGWDSERSDDEHRRAVSNSEQGFFITNSRADTGQDHRFLDYVDRGLAEGFHEIAGNNSSVPNDTVQWQYWTLLSQLNCGSEFVGTYGDYAWRLEYQAEHDIEPIHDFVNRHVGWEPHPTLAPAAWIALKPPTTPPPESFSTDDYGAFLTEVADDGSDVSDVGSVKYTYKGPTNLGHPTTQNEAMLWARSCPAGKRLHFAVDDAFRNAHDNSFDLEVVYHDTYQGQFFVRAKNQRGQLKYWIVPMTGDGKWRRAVVQLRGVEMRNDVGPGIDFALEADAQATTFHRLVLTPN